MDLHDQRMQCLKMAFELGGKPEAVLSAAQQLLDFLSGPAPSASAEAVSATSERLGSEESVPDPIAACGTVLVMQEGGELADAVATAEAAAPVAHTDDIAAAEPASPSDDAAPSDVAEEIEPALTAEAVASSATEEVPSEAETVASVEPAGLDDMPASVAPEETGEVPASIN
jgi:hypothetical protein